jgi:hypothetical protein
MTATQADALIAHEAVPDDLLNDVAAGLAAEGEVRLLTFTLTPTSPKKEKLTSDEASRQ